MSDQPATTTEAAEQDIVPRNHIHPLYSVRVTEAKEMGRPAYVGQSLMNIDGEMYGGVLCSVSKGTPEASNELAQLIADAWNATGHLRGGGA